MESEAKAQKNRPDKGSKQKMKVNTRGTMSRD